MKKILLISIIALFALTGCTVALTNTDKATDAPTTVTFAVIGDNEGINSHYDAFMREIAQDTDVQFVLHVGDLVSNGGKKELDELLTHQASFNLTVPFYAVPGNHDIYDDPERTDFKNALGKIPRSVDVGSVHLVLLDNANRKVGFSDSELSWLEKDLQQAEDKHIILAYHRPFNYPLAATIGDDETSASRASNEKFSSIIGQHNIMAIFNGHIHTYLEFPFIIKDDTNSNRSIPDYISGGGGQPPQDIFATIFSADYHWLKVTVKDGNLSVEKMQ